MTEFSFLAKTIPLRLSYMSGHNASEFIQIPGSIGSKNKHPKGQQLTEHFVFGKKKSTEKKKNSLQCHTYCQGLFAQALNRANERGSF